MRFAAGCRPNVPVITEFAASSPFVAAATLTIATVCLNGPASWRNRGLVCGTVKIGK
jgi:hypothetical protein